MNSCKSNPYNMFNIKNNYMWTTSHLCRNSVPAEKGRTNVCGGMTSCTNVIKLS